MSTVGQLIDRAFREYLYPPDRQPATGRLDATIAAGATSLVYTAGWFSQAEIDSIGSGSIIEIDLELLLVTVHATGTRTLTVVRGQYGTTDAGHTVGAGIRVKPPFTRIATFDAIADVLDGLYGMGIYRRRTISITTAATPVEITEGDAALSIKFQYPETDLAGTRWMTLPVEILRDNTEVAASGNAVQFFNVAAGKTGTLTYAARFPRPTAESADLAGANFDLESRHERLLVVGAVAQLISGVPVGNAVQDYIADSLRAQGFPAASGRSVVTAMLQYFEYLVSKAVRDLDAEDGIVTEVTDVVWSG